MIRLGGEPLPTESMILLEGGPWDGNAIPKERLSLRHFVLYADPEDCFDWQGEHDLERTTLDFTRMHTGYYVRTNRKWEDGNFERWIYEWRGRA